MSRHCEARSSLWLRDCFVAALLAMTGGFTAGGYVTARHEAVHAFGLLRRCAPRNDWQNKKAVDFSTALHVAFGGVDGTRTRDPRRDRPVF